MDNILVVIAVALMLVNQDLQTVADENLYESDSENQLIPTCSPCTLQNESYFDPPSPCPSIIPSQPKDQKNAIEVPVNNYIELRSPTSYELYQLYFYDNKKYQSTEDYVKDRNRFEIAKKDTGRSTVEFNDIMHTLIQDEYKAVSNFLKSRKGASFKLTEIPGLPIIVGLYLMRHDGEVSFQTNYLSAVNEGKNSPACKELREVFHLDASSKQLLRPDLKQKLITLLSLQMELDREYHRWYQTVKKLYSDVHSRRKRVFISPPIETKIQVFKGALHT